MRRMICAARLAAVVLAFGLLALGCGASDEEAPTAGYGMESSQMMALDQSPAARAAQAIEGAAARVMEVTTESESADTFAAQSAPAAPAAPAPAMAKGMAPVPQSQPAQVVKESALAVQMQAVDTSALATGFDMASVQAAFVQQERIIVRTVDMELTVENVAESVDAVGEVAREYNGWLVGADRSATHRGRVSIRVPAQSLDDAVKDIRGIGLEVVSESTTSQDVTDEYVDSRSRLTSLRATEQALLNLFERAQTVEAALAVQQELAKLQAEIEALLGRIKFLEETAAFSLINVGLSLAAGDMEVEAGDDRTLNVGEPARFRATFTPPEGIDTFSFVWDFGDGTEPVYGVRTVATSEPGQRVTATVHHAYGDDLESPYIVSLDITGVGEAGQVEGTDTFTVTAKEIPPIEVFLTAEYSAEQGEEVQFSASFTRPAELSDFKYKWDFGDGSPAVEGAPADGVTQISATHTYENYRNQEYRIALTVTAQSEAGEVTGESSHYIYIAEDEGLMIGGWSAGDNATQATRALSIFAQGVGTLLIWAVIFSPAWLIIGAIVYGLLRLRRRRRAETPEPATGEDE